MTTSHTLEDRVAYAAIIQKALRSADYREKIGKVAEAKWLRSHAEWLGEQIKKEVAA